MAGVTNLRSSVTCCLSVACPVKGVAVLGSGLCVLLSRDQNQIEIFEVTNGANRPNYLIVKTLSVPGLRAEGMQDMAACAHNDCLYITDSVNKWVHRVKMEQDPVQWPACRPSTSAECYLSPCGVSVTAAHNVLVTYSTTATNYMQGCSIGAIKEFTTRGDMVRTIKDMPSLGITLKALELPPDKFVVCSSSTQWCVQIINSSGNVEWSYQELPGYSGQQIVGVALDTDGFIFVADVRSRRVMSVSPTSVGSRVLLTSENGLNGKPGKMCFEPVNRRLFVVDTEEKTTRIVVMKVAPFSW